mgnify:CR=1 FL=1
MRLRLGSALHLGLGLAMAFAFGGSSAYALEPVDVELVLSVDVSLSMDEDEQRLQRNGYAAAFRDPEVLAAIRNGRYRRIALTYVEWGGIDSARVVVPWMIIDGPDAADRFSRILDEAPLVRAARTSISNALLFSGSLFEANGYSGERRVIDVSGDGPNNQGEQVTRARDAVVARGITINGLPLISEPAQLTGAPDPRDLDIYYEDCVIGGLGAFLVVVRHPSEFAFAIRRKLILEIAAPRTQPRVIPAQFTFREQRTDCLVGEKRWAQ